MLDFDQLLKQKRIESGRRGGSNRAKALTPEQRSESARNAAKERWKALGSCECDVCARCRNRQYQKKFRDNQRKALQGK